MRMLMNITFPPEAFNKAVSDGSIGGKIQRIMDAIKPETAYFTEQDGQRGALMVVILENSYQVPALAEPWFLTFNADVKFRIVMTPEDLQKSGIEELGKQWGTH